MMETWAMRQFPWWGKTLPGYPWTHTPSLSISRVEPSRAKCLNTESRWCKFSQEESVDKEAWECLMRDHFKIIIRARKSEKKVEFSATVSSSHSLFCPFFITHRLLDQPYIGKNYQKLINWHFSNYWRLSMAISYQFMRVSDPPFPKS